MLHKPKATERTDPPFFLVTNSDGDAWRYETQDSLLRDVSKPSHAVTGGTRVLYIIPDESRVRDVTSDVAAAWMRDAGATASQWSCPDIFDPFIGDEYRELFDDHGRRVDADERSAFVRRRAS
jgi:hypothetical protein